MAKFMIISFLATLFLFGITGVEPLKNVQIVVPAAVKINEHVTLRCLFDLDHNESLYAIKWYRGEDEFYRYVPKEVPPIQAFDLMKEIVDISKSDAHSVYLKSVRHEQTGLYKCEVSADSPGFDTEIVHAQMTVVEFTDNPPLLESGKSKYEVGERIRANCSFGPTIPSANISWLINNKEVPPQYIHETPVLVDGHGGHWVKSTIEMDTTASSFPGGKLKLKCVGTLFVGNHKSAEVQIDEEKPRSASVKAGSKDQVNQATQHKPGSTNSGLPISISESSSSSSIHGAVLPLISHLILLFSILYSNISFSYSPCCTKR